MNLDYTRSSIWWTGLPVFQMSSVQGGYRPVVIISSTAGCLSSDIVQVCPITTKIKPLHINVDIHPITNGVPNQVLTNQTMTVPKNTLSRPSGYLTREEIEKVEEGILISLGIAKPVADKIKANQEALANAKKDREEIERLVPQAKEVMNKLTEVINRLEGKKISPVKTGRIKRSREEILSFIKEWEDPYNKKSEVVEAFGFNNYGTAWNFYKTQKKKIEEEKS